MASGTTLLNLRTMLLAEIGDYGTPNTTRTAEMNTLLSDKQKWLASEYSWPFLQQFWDVAVNAGSQYNNMPVVNDSNLGESLALDLMRPFWVDVFWNQVYDEMQYGIGRDEYNWMNFALGQSTDPIQRWRFNSNVNETVHPNQFEVWPVPVTPQTVRFTGQRVMLPLVQDTDTADLDDMLIVMFAAGELLTRKKQQDGQLKLGLAKQRLEKLKSAYPVRDRDVILGGGKRNWREQRRVVPMVIVAHG